MVIESIDNIEVAYELGKKNNVYMPIVEMVYKVIYEQLDPQAIEDLGENNRFWDQFEGTVAEVSTKVNDTYLKAHSQTDGVKSYGRMVDLMLVYYRSF